MGVVIDKITKDIKNLFTKDKNTCGHYDYLDKEIDVMNMKVLLFTNHEGRKIKVTIEEYNLKH